MQKIRERETKLLAKLNAPFAQLEQSPDGKYIFVLSPSGIARIDTGSSQQKSIGVKAEMELNAAAEREYMYGHAWRQTMKKFYDPAMHGVDWACYKAEYAKFPPPISNNWDYADMLSELLGELNASHTGNGHRPQSWILRRSKILRRF